MPQQQDRYLRIVVVGLVAVLAAAVVMLVLQRRDGPQPLEIALADPTPGPGGPIEVYLTGAVMKPGVYEMRDGDRVIDLLFTAGGGAPDADLEAVNLAAKLSDEAQVVVPRQGEAPVEAAAGGQTSGVLGVTGPVDINRATREELDALPGIGEVYSQRIVDSRQIDGPYATPDDLVVRRLIPQGTYDKIRDLLVANP